MCKLAHRKLISKPAEILYSLSGNKITTKERTLIELCGKFLEVTIIEAMTHKLLLGDDSFRALGAIFYYKTQVVSLSEQDLKYKIAKRKVLRLAATSLEEYLKVRPAVFASDSTPNGMMPTVAMKINDHTTIKPTLPPALE